MPLFNFETDLPNMDLKELRAWREDARHDMHLYESGPVRAGEGAGIGDAGMIADLVDLIVTLNNEIDRRVAGTPF